MRKFEKRRRFEDATAFRAEYQCYLHDEGVEHRDFNSARSLSQWCDRNDNDETFGIVILRRLALIGGEWVPYTTIGKKTITLPDLKTIVRNLEYDAVKSSENENG